MGRDAGQPRKRLWLDWAAALAIVAGFCGLVLWGLGWGIPSQERARLEGSSPQARALSPELMEQSWRIWGSRGRRDEVADLYPRHVFNPIRSYHPDEYQVFKSLSNMRPGRLDLDPKNYIYPSLHTYLVGATIGACHLVGAARLERSLAFYFDHPEAMGRLYLVGRALTLLAAAGTLVLVWRVGASMGRGIGLLALGLLAAMPAFAVHSHHLTRDTLTALAAIAFFASCRRVAKMGTPRWYDLAGAAAGLCVACQFFAAALWALIPIAAILHCRREGSTTKAVAGGLVASLVIMFAVFALTSPYHLLRADRFLADFGSETTHVGSGGFTSRLLSFAWAAHLPCMLPSLVSWAVVPVIAVGIGWAAWRREDNDWLLLAWLLIWAVIVGFDGRAYSRYYVGLLPALALLGARGLVATWTLCRRLVPWPSVRTAGATAALGAVFCPAGLSTAAWCELYACENVRTIAGQWIAKTVPRGASIGVTQWPWQYEMPPINAERYRLVAMEDSPRRSPYDLARLLAERPDYFVTSSLQVGPLPGRRVPADDKGRFWHFIFVGGGLYQPARTFEVGHRFLGTDMLRLPEDMRYVNPTIYIFERRIREARL